MIIENEEILPGEHKEVKINVSRLPSGTKMFVQCHVFRGLEPGPRILILAGVHGDEINGIESVRRTLELGIYNKIKKGSVIVIPLLNVFGFINFSRAVPDGKDVNRSFPGSPAGSLASRVASVLTKKILPHVDYALDLHTGGASRYNYPQLRFNADDSKAFSLAKVFGAPFLIEQSKISGSFRKTATDLDVVVLVYEAGESVRFDGYAIEIGIDGIKRVLRHLEIIEEAPVRRHDMIFFKSTGWIRAAKAGLFTWSRSSGAIIEKGEPIGTIQSPQGDFTTRILAKRDGYIIGHNNASVVHNGDALYHVGYNGERL